jgi:hypothetical protein
MTGVQQVLLSLLTVFISASVSAVVTHLKLSREHGFLRTLRTEDRERRILDEKINIEERMTRGMAAMAVARSRLHKHRYFGSRDAVEKMGSPESIQIAKDSLVAIDAAAQDVHRIYSELQAVCNRATHYFGDDAVAALKAYWLAFGADSPDLDLDIIQTSLDLQKALETKDDEKVRQALRAYDEVSQEVQRMCDDKLLDGAANLVVRAMTREIKQGSEFRR